MARDVVERLREQLPPKDEWPLDRWAEWAVPVSADVLADLVAVVEAAKEVVRREARSEYSSIYAAPSEFARILNDSLARLYAGSSGESD